MTVLSEAYGRALREHAEHERDLLAKVQCEALNPELLPEGQEARNETVVVDGHAIPAPKRIRGTLTVRWSR